MCWTGFYANQAAINSITDEGFTVDIYSNNSSTCGSLGTFSFPSALVATRTLSPVVSGNDGQTRSNPARFNGPPITYTNFYEWNVTFNTPITLASGCYWIEIISRSTTPWNWLSNWGDPNSNVRNGGDQFFHHRSTSGSYGIGTRVTGWDLAFCLSFAMNPLSSCPPGPPPANTSCITATPLSVGGAPVVGFTTVTGGGVDSGGGQLPPAFGTVIDNSATGGIWYTVVGNGQNITVSTCNSGAPPCAGAPPGTDHDTMLAVYCAPTCAGPFKSVAFNNNQTSPPCTVFATASTVTFPSVAGQTYYVYSMRAGFSGFFYITATSSALDTLTPVPCAIIIDPPAPITSFPAGAIVETEFCSAGSAATAAGESCQTAYVAALGTQRCGTLDSSPTTFDDDWYRFPDVSTATAFDVELMCESPVNVFVYALGPGTCPGTGAPGSFQAGYVIQPNNVAGRPQFQVRASTGPVFVRVQPTRTDGMSCSVNLSRYCLRVDAAPVGACCAGIFCVPTTLEDCASPSGSNGRGWMGSGTACGPTLCSPTTGAPVPLVGACCLVDGACALTSRDACAGSLGDPRRVFMGDGTPCTGANTCPPAQACCLADARCTPLISPACVLAGGSSITGRLCLPNSCSPGSQNGRCCAGARCIAGVTITACAAQAVAPAGVSFAPGVTNCNPPGVTNAPCCVADYNKVGGVGVQDIFDFVSDWFNLRAGTTDADNSGTLTISDVLVFLAAWFRGC